MNLPIQNYEKPTVESHDSTFSMLFSSLQFKGTLTYSRLYSKKYASENGQFHFLLIGFDVGVIRISELGSHISE